MFRSKVQLLAAGVSVLAINAVATGAQAQVNDPGLYQNDSLPVDGQNFYTVPNGFFGGDINDVLHGGTISVTCGQSGATPASGTAQPGCTSAVQGELMQFITTTGSVANNLTNPVNADVATVAAVTSRDIAGLGTANANAFMSEGITQFASSTTPTTGDATNSFTNSGTFNILVGADAAVDAGTANAVAQIENAGVRQQALSDDNSTNTINNTGTLNVLVTANADADDDANGNGFSATARAQIDGAGVGQIAGDSFLGISPSQNASNTLTNGAAGSINVVADANAVANDGVALATASIDIGVGQIARGSESAVNTITNSGNIDVRGEANAFGNTARATATIGDDGSMLFNNEALGQRAYSTTADGVATNNLASIGTIDLVANAGAFADVGDAHAIGSIETGVYQYALAGQTATVTLNNGAGNLNVNVNADAVAQNAADNAGMAYAYAYANTMIEQRAIANGTDDDSGKASVSLVNTGTIGLGVDAAATADSRAIAYAYIGTGIYQFASGQTEGSATINNSGTLGITANAAANGAAAGLSVGEANAYAVIQAGISQSADAFTATALGVLGEADVVLTNSGTLNITATASANAGAGLALATEGDAYAYALIGNAINQSAFADTDASVSLTNALGGTINIVADAHAIAANGDAAAYAGIETGIGQSATDASVTLVNNGTVNMHAVAAATADVTNVTVGPPAVTTHSGAAYALATIGTAVSQYAYGVTVASVDFTNSGLFDINASAAAKGGSEATASAFIDSGVDQYAYAHAADADASVSITNSGTLNVAANAAASNVSDTAFARGDIDTGIFQYAYAIGARASADASLTNAAGGVIGISAGAKATGTQAYASASINTGIFQHAYAGFGEDASATVGLTNNGSLTIAAAATANADGVAAMPGSHDAYAWASVDTGISQYAYAVGSEASASVDLTNSGALNITANAKANGVVGVAYAAGTIDVGIGQYAYASLLGENASVTLTNALGGTLNIAADAAAAGSEAYAYASIDVGIGQIAHVNASNGNADATITNAGTLTITANADASAIQTAGEVYAYAYIGTGIYQEAAANGEDGDANVVLTNDGSLTITARALASAVSESAEAFASVETGIGQNATANGNSGNASATLTNGGTLSIRAEADAIVDGTEGSSASAYAYIGTGIYQQATADGFSGAADVALTNTAALSIVADAFASAVSSSASATANIRTGIWQGAFASEAYGDATVALTNGTAGVLSVSALASANGSEASAFATVQHGIVQSATADGRHGDAIVSLTNNGSLSITATADAVATNDSASAGASITEFGIFQYAGALGEDGEASVTLTNSGTLRVAVDAAATASQSSATANAFVNVGIGQYAYAGGQPGGDADAALVNTGGIELSAVAAADGSSAYAYASFNDGIVQYAQADGTDGNANVSLTNSGTIEGVLTATASATEGEAYAAARMNRLIQESAYANGIDGIANVTLTNGPGADAVAQPGTITVDLNATANATHQRGPLGAFAYAYATMDEVVFQYAQASGEGGRATVTVANNGLIDVTAFASAQADFGASAVAHADTVIEQRAFARGIDGDALVRLTNAEGATISADMSANATGGAFGMAEAGIYEGIRQLAIGSGADAEVTNHGTLSFTADANALAGVYAYADAYAKAIEQTAVGVTHASASAVNDGALTVAANANAHAGNITPFGGDAVAAAYAAGIDQFARARAVYAAGTGTGTITTTLGDVFNTSAYSYAATGPASVTVHNTAAIDISAVATATGDNGYGIAEATAYGIDQYAGGNPATALVTNDAPLTVLATAKANGSASATAYADGFGIRQDAVSYAFAYAYAEPARRQLALVPIPVPDSVSIRRELTPGGPASATVENTTAIDVTADATAVSGGGAANAFVGATQYTTGGVTVTSATGVQGIWQNVFGSEASALVNNSGAGSITVDLAADAHGVDAAQAIAIGGGVLQFASAVAYAETEVYTTVGAYAYTQTLTTTPTGDVDVTLVNDGTISLTASANAVADTGAAFALVAGQSEGFFGTTVQLPAAGVVQYGHGADVTLTVENNGSLTVDANAAADGGTSAVAVASAAGVLQLAGAFGWTTVATQVAPATEPTAGPTTFTPNGTVSVSLTNTDTIDVSVTADANAATFASASANAIGVGQLALGEDWDATLINNGDLLVSALAHAAVAGTAVAHASAVGYGLVASGGVLTVVNTDTIKVTANANAADTAVANAVGISAVGTVLGTGVGATPGLINGTITNSGIIDVRALVSQGTDATATGITVSAASATPVTPTPAAASPRNLIISNNGGTITAAVSYNGAAAPAAIKWHHGMAIDVSDANVGGTRINLTGAGTIYGNIDLSTVADDPLVAGVEGDEIVVSAGETRFDGIINPEFAEAPLGPQPGEAPSASQGVDPSPTFGGTLSIVPGGSLFLRDNSTAANAAMYDGPAQAYVSTLNAGGNLVYELQISGPNANAHYPQIFANTANLGGTLEIRRTAVPGPALFDDVYYDNIIEADVRNGKFTNANDVPIWTPPNIFMSAKIIYDANNNVDINIDRTEFDVACANFGGTFNECSAAGGIENVYSTSLTGPFAGVVANLFTLNQAGYLEALNQLAGAQYASYLQGLRNNSFATNSIVSDQIDCAISIRAVDQCRDRNGTGRFWVMGKYNWANYDGDQEAGDYDLKGWTGMVGADYTFGNFTLGAFVGYRDIDLNFDWYNGDMSATGWQGGLYAGYDVGSFYVRGIGSYSSLDGDSKRDLNFATTIGTLNGDPDVNIMSFYGEAGARFDMGSSWLTPFAAIDYTDIKLKSFTETGPAAVVGAALAFDSQHEKQTSSLLGVKWAGNWGGIVPEAKLAWRHDFGDRTFDFDARFAGAPAGSDHRQISARMDRESIVGGLSLAAAFGSKTTGRIGYQGRFNSDVTDHSIYGSLTFHFGGAPAPAPEPIPTPPAPPPAAEPAPPPAVVTPGPFIVFFDWDKSDITPQAAAILDNAAAAYQQTGSAQVMLAGNADRSGPADYNVGLSQRRADAVKAYLAGRGIPENVITTEANGENRPIVETADGVREPQNRNVQITYGPGSGQ